MPDFKTQHAAALLEAHQPNQRAYLCSEIGLEPNADSVAEIDASYAELRELGYVADIPDHTVMVYSGGIPKHTFKITEAGVNAKTGE